MLHFLIRFAVLQLRFCLHWHTVDSPHWSGRTEIHTDWTQPPFWRPAPQTADDDESLRENSGREPENIWQQPQHRQKLIQDMSDCLTKSIWGFSWSAAKSLSFMEVRMMARSPRDVPMPWKQIQEDDWCSNMGKVSDRGQQCESLCPNLFIRLWKSVKANQRRPYEFSSLKPQTYNKHKHYNRHITLIKTV